MAIHKKRPLNTCDDCDAPNANLYYYGLSSKNWLCDNCFNEIPIEIRKNAYRSKNAQRVVELWEG